MCVCGGGEEKRKAKGYLGGGGEEKRKAGGYMGGGDKKKKGNKKEKRNGQWGLCVWWEKRGSGKESRKKKLKRKKLNWFYLYVHFVLFGVKCRIVKIYLEDVYDIFLS